MIDRPELLRHIADAVGTPTYVYDAAEIRRRYRDLARAFRKVPHRICYAVKANSTLAVLRLLRDLGAGADIVSEGELARVLRAGFAPGDLVFSGAGKTPRELAEAVERRVGLINIESADEVRILGEWADRADRPVTIGIRVNPDVTAETHPYTRTSGPGMKFGVPVDQVLSVARCAARAAHLRVACVGMHIGSQISDPAHFARGADALGEVVAALREDGIGTLRWLDVGGGLGVRYTTEAELSAAQFAAAVVPVAEATGLELIVEPGRFLVGPAGLLLTRCLYRKHSGGRNLVVVDAGMNDLIRPSLYGAAHEIRVVSAEGGAGWAAGSDDPVDVVGPLCEAGDFLGLGRDVPGVGRGSLLAVLGCGAYGFSMASTYNSRPRPAEVLVGSGDRWAVIRRRETAADLMRGERVRPRWRSVSP